MSRGLERWQSLVENTDLGIKEQTHASAKVLRNLIPDLFPQIYAPNCLSRSKAQSLKISHAIIHRQMFMSVAAHTLERSNTANMCHVPCSGSHR